MSKRYLVNSIMKDKVWTDEEKRVVYGKPIDLSWYDNRIQQQQQADIFRESMRLKAIGVALFDDGFRGQDNEPEIKTKYFKTYADYFMAQEKVRRQIEFKHEPVDLGLEQKLVAETKNIRQQRIEAARKRAMDK